ncbi:diaminopimelate epimerase [Sesbania bispinosa]|nr:diaminopimelate epimerase [Sesbania bispinosa]
MRSGKTQRWKLARIMTSQAKPSTTRLIRDVKSSLNKGRSSPTPQLQITKVQSNPESEN